jgi:16S rRNA processing protein RimM
MPEGLGSYTTFYTATDRGVIPLPIKGWRTHDSLILLELAGLNDRDEAGTLNGKTLYVPRSEMPPLKEGEYYHADLIGAKVVDTQENELGRVVDVKDWGDYDMLVIVTGKTSWMLPVIDDYVIDILPEKDLIIVDGEAGIGPEGFKK